MLLGRWPSSIGVSKAGLRRIICLLHEGALDIFHQTTVGDRFSVYRLPLWIIAKRLPGGGRSKLAWMSN